MTFAFLCLKTIGALHQMVLMESRASLRKTALCEGAARPLRATISQLES